MSESARTSLHSNAATLADLVADVAQAAPDKTAILFQDMRISYGTLHTLIESAADALAARGVGKGDRVVVMLPNIPHFVIAYYAVMRLGAVVVPVNVLYKAGEIAYILRDSGASTAIVFESLYEQFAEALDDVNKHGLKNAIVVAANEAPAGTIPWSLATSTIEGGAPTRTPVEVVPDDVAVICYTSGTTGKAKGAMLSHHNFLANAAQVARVEGLRVEPTDTVLLVLPLFHIFAMNVGMNMTLRVGGTIDLMVRFEPVAVLEEIQRHKASVFLGAPPMFVSFVNLPDLTSYDVSSLRVINSGAAALPVAVLERFKTLTGKEIVEGYGLTETSPVSHSNAAGASIKPGTIGLPIPGVEARIVDVKDQDAPDGQEGEIVLRGENLMIGYWNKPRETAEAMRNGWFHTGDIAVKDADGYYTIVDRKKDMINAGGFKIWPREVEEVLYHHPAVAEAAIIPSFDPYAGERPIAYIVLKDGVAATQEELIAFVKARLASYKAPTYVEFRTELPKNLTGKIMRRLLREEVKHPIPVGDL